MTLMLEQLTELKGQPVAVLCARYWYRGILTAADEGAILLENARAVEETGKASGEKPSVEDPIPSSVLISLGAVEIVCQPAWVWHGFEGQREQIKKAKK
jgi:hypothetical protein